MPVCEALAYVQQHRSSFDVVQVKYNDEVRFVVFDVFPKGMELSVLHILGLRGYQITDFA